jgi:hypothetical protein
MARSPAAALLCLLIGVMPVLAADGADSTATKGLCAPPGRDVIGREAREKKPKPPDPMLDFRIAVAERDPDAIEQAVARFEKSLDRDAYLYNILQGRLLVARIRNAADDFGKSLRDFQKQVPRLLRYRAETEFGLKERLAFHSLAHVRALGPATSDVALVDLDKLVVNLEALARESQSDERRIDAALIAGELLAVRAALSGKATDFAGASSKMMSAIDEVTGPYAKWNAERLLAGILLEQAYLDSGQPGRQPLDAAAALVTGLRSALAGIAARPRRSLAQIQSLLGAATDRAEVGAAASDRPCLDNADLDQLDAAIRIARLVGGVEPIFASDELVAQLVRIRAAGDRTALQPAFDRDPSAYVWEARGWASLATRGTEEGVRIRARAGLRSALHAGRRVAEGCFCAFDRRELDELEAGFPERSLGAGPSSLRPNPFGGLTSVGIARDVPILWLDG